MKKVYGAAIVLGVTGAAFFGGVAVGKGGKEAKFVARDEVKMEDVGGPKLGDLYGDHKKGPYGALMELPGNTTSPAHTHSGDYEAVQIEGTSKHWLNGEDGSKAKLMTPGSYWLMPGKLGHVSSCVGPAKCVLFIWQKGKFDFALTKEEAEKMKAGSGAGSAVKKP